MLVIRDAQMALFGQVARRRLFERVLRHVRTHHAVAIGALKDAELRERLERALSRAIAHGLAEEAKIAFFIGLSLEIGPRFDEHERIQRELARADLRPEQRLDNVARLPEQVWVEASLL